MTRLAARPPIARRVYPRKLTARPPHRRCHKPNYVDITLAQLANYSAVHPALKTLIISTSSISTLGRPGAFPPYSPRAPSMRRTRAKHALAPRAGCDMAPDRFVESINRMVEGAQGTKASFASKIFSGPELVALSHVAHVC